MAQGDFTAQAPVTSRDELGVLTAFVQRDDGQLADARAENEGSAARAAKAQIESILDNLSAGVLAFDDDASSPPNAAPISGALARSWIAELDAFAADARALPVEQATRLAATTRGGAEGAASPCMRGHAPPAAPAGGGYVVVFDDVTQLMQAQRDAAWAEVARRLAHEIKNPLTPIQLSAERLADEARPKLSRPDAETLRRATATIVNQVAAMKRMVDDFRHYARTRAGQCTRSI